MKWLYLRLAIVAAAFLGGVIGHGRDLNTGYTVAQVVTVTFALCAVGMLFVIGIQALNPRSAPVWTYPSWRANPFTMTQPLQLFHLGGYFFLISGIGGLLHVAVDASLPAIEPAIFCSVGAGTICGVWLCSRLFRRKMART